MPRLRRLSGLEIIDILDDFGFAVISIKGSHHKLRRVVDGSKQTLIVPVHGKKPLQTGTILSIYRTACTYIPEDQIALLFYTES
jgi:predicted RNA binding protein YcfA (HicA-like mRNA interferase family)